MIVIKFQTGQVCDFWMIQIRNIQTTGRIRKQASSRHRMMPKGSPEDCFHTFPAFQNSLHTETGDNGGQTA